jgi:hypothetical protein
MSNEATLTRNMRPLESQAVLPWEKEDGYTSLYDALVADFRPKGEAQRLLVERLAWIAWRRKRIQYAERALHLAQVSEHTGVSSDSWLTRQALIGSGVSGQAATVKDAVETGPEDDTRQGAYNAEEDDDLNKAIAILEGSKTKAALEAAIALLRDDTIAWWNNVLEDEGEGDSTSERAERLLAFLSGVVREQMDDQIAAVEQRPAVRLMAWGKSVDALRLMKLMLLDGELDRQFERTLGMLLALQTKRSDEGKNAG